MLKPKTVGAIGKSCPRSISRSINPRGTFERAGAWLVLLPIVISLALVAAVLAQHAWADIPPPRPFPKPPGPVPPNPDGLTLSPGAAEQETSGGPASGRSPWTLFAVVGAAIIALEGVFWVGLIKTRRRNDRD